MKSTPEQNARYIRNECVDCGADGHAPGRPRCDSCSAANVVVTEPELRRKGARG